MGRRKIQIAPIPDDRNRNVTFGKRRNGLFKKAYELGVLCQVDVAVLVWSHTGKLHIYSTQDTPHGLLDRYQGQSSEDIETLRPASYNDDGSLIVKPQNGDADTNEKNGGSSAANKKRRRSEDDTDDDEDDEIDEDKALAGAKREAPAIQNSMSNEQHEANLLHNQIPQMSSNVNSDLAQSQSQPSSSASPYGPVPNGYPFPHHFHPGYAYPGHPHPNTNQAFLGASGLYHPAVQAQAQAQAQAAAAQAAATYGYSGAPPHMQVQGGQHFIQQNSARYSSQAYTPTRSPPLPDHRQSTIGNLQSQAFAGKTSSNAIGAPRQSLGSEDSASPHDGRRQPLHASLMGIGPGRQPETSRQNSSHFASAEWKPQQMTMPDSLLQMPETYVASPSQLFPEIHRSMTHFAESQALNGMDMPTPVEDNEGNGRTFKWPSIASAARNETAEVVGRRQSSERLDAAVQRPSSRLSSSRPRISESPQRLPDQPQPQPQQQQSSSSSISPDAKQTYEMLFAKPEAVRLAEGAEISPPQ